jgi:hypothetical protein
MVRVVSDPTLGPFEWHWPAPCWRSGGARATGTGTYIPETTGGAGQGGADTTT